MPCNLEYRDLSDQTGREAWQGFDLTSATGAWTFLFMARGQAGISAGTGMGSSLLLEVNQALVLVPDSGLHLLPSLTGRGTAFVRCQFLSDPAGLLPVELLGDLANKGALTVLSPVCRNQLVELGLAGAGRRMPTSLRMSMSAVVMALSEDGATRDDAPPGFGSSMGRHQVERAINWMMDHVDCAIRLEELAEWLGVSAESLNLSFRRVVGDSPVHYHQALRHREARRLLSNADVSIKEISWRLGFKDQYAFSRSFRSHTGQSPRDYRQTHLIGHSG